MNWIQILITFYLSGFILSLLNIFVIFRKHHSEWAHIKEGYISNYKKWVILVLLMYFSIGFLSSIFFTIILYINHKRLPKDYYENYNPKFSLLDVKSIVIDFRLCGFKIGKYNKHIRIDLGIISLLLITQTIYDVIGKLNEKNPTLIDRQDFIKTNELTAKILESFQSTEYYSLSNPSTISYIRDHPSESLQAYNIIPIINEYLTNNKDDYSSISS